MARVLISLRLNPPLASEPRLSWRKDQRRTDVKAGRFSASEKETIRAAAVLYAQSKNLPTDNFDWLFNTTKSNKVCRA